MKIFLLLLILFPAPKGLPPLPDEVLPNGTLLHKNECVYIVLNYLPAETWYKARYFIKCISVRGDPDDTALPFIHPADRLAHWDKIERPKN